MDTTIYIYTTNRSRVSIGVTNTKIICPGHGAWSTCIEISSRLFDHHAKRVSAPCACAHKGLKIRRTLGPSEVGRGTPCVTMPNLVVGSNDTSGPGNLALAFRFSMLLRSIGYR